METFHNDGYILLLILTAGFSIFMAVYALRQRRIAGASLVSNLLLCGGWFSLTYAFELVSTTASSRLFWIKLEYITIVALVPLLLVFSLRFTGRARQLLKWPYFLILLIEPLLVLGAVWTTPLHTLFYQSFSLDISSSSVKWVVVYGPLFWMHTAYSITMAAISLIILLTSLPRTIPGGRRQILMICLGVTLAGAGSLLFIARATLNGYDPTPLLSVAGGGVIAWFVLRSRMLEMSPIALEGVLRSMGDGVVLLDRRRMVTTFNPAAERITGVTEAQALGASLVSVLPELAVRVVGLPVENECDMEVELGLAQDRRMVAVRGSPVRDSRGQVQGRLLLLRDITEQRRAHQALVEREAELSQTRNFLEKIIATAPLGIAIYNPNTLTIEFANPVFSRSEPGWQATDRVSVQDIASLFFQDNRELRQTFIRNWLKLEDGEVRMLEYPRKVGDQWTWTRLYYSVFERDVPGKVSKILAITSDITEYKLILDNLARSEDRYRSLFERIPIGLYRVTHDGWLLEANPGLVQMFGYPDRASLMEKNVAELYANPADRQRFLTLMEADHPGPSFEFQMQRRDGEIIWTSDTPRSVTDAEGQRIYEGSLAEITQQKKIEARLQTSEEKFRDTFNLSPNSMMLIDAAGKILDCNMGSLRVYGGNSKEEMVGRNISQYVPAEDQSQLSKLLRDTLEDSGQPAREMTLLRQNGEPFPAEISTSAMPGLAGQPQTMIVTVSDILPRKEAETRLKDAQTQLAQRVSELELRTHQISMLTEMSNMMQVCLNPSETYSFVGHYGALLFPQAAGQLMMLSADRKQLIFQAGWGLPLDTNPTSYPLEACWALRSGQAYLAPADSLGHLCQHFQSPPEFGSLCVPIFSEGRIIGLINMSALHNDAQITDAQLGMASAMAEQIGLALSNLQLHENLREQAIHDQLTGLFNRYYLREAFENTLTAAQQSGQPVSLIMMDLDYFKALNTRHGHVNADVVLAKFGSLLRDFVAHGEVAFRFGGDEFVVILPNTDLEQAAERADQLRQRVSRLVVQPSKQIVIKNLTVSVGISGCPEHGNSLDEMLQAADTAMFRAKEQRDQVQIAD